MRELKFRFWNTTCNKLVYLEQYKLGDMNRQLSFIDLFNDNRGWIWEQYTGLKDNNGKEIYEGDIVRCWNGLDYSDGIVKWSDNSAAYFVKYLKKKKGFSEDDWLCDCYCEVIGNIHENPELLGDEDDTDL